MFFVIFLFLLSIIDYFIGYYFPLSFFCFQPQLFLTTVLSFFFLKNRNKKIIKYLFLGILIYDILFSRIYFFNTVIFFFLYQVIFFITKQIHFSFISYFIGMLFSFFCYFFFQFFFLSLIGIQQFSSFFFFSTIIISFFPFHVIYSIFLYYFLGIKSA